MAQLKLIATLSLAATVVACCVGLVTFANGQNLGLSNLPGTQTAAGILASSADGMSRYLAPDGPIQPGITMIGTLPVRGVELANQGITSISRGLQNGARSIAQSGNRADTSMPGLQSLSSSMPDSFGRIGNMMQGAIRSKNNFIRGQAESGIQSGNRLGSMMQNGL